MVLMLVVVNRTVIMIVAEAEAMKRCIYMFVISSAAMCNMFYTPKLGDWSR